MRQRRAWLSLSGLGRGQEAAHYPVVLGACERLLRDGALHNNRASDRPWRRTGHGRPWRSRHVSHAPAPYPSVRRVHLLVASPLHPGLCRALHLQPQLELVHEGALP